MRIRRRNGLVRNRTLVGHSILISTVMLAPCLGAPTAMVLMSSPSVAATAPVDADLAKLLADLKAGKLSDDSLRYLRMKANGNADDLAIFLERVRYAAEKQKITNVIRLVPPPAGVKLGQRYNMQVAIFDQDSEELAEYTIGTGINNYLEVAPPIEID